MRAPASTHSSLSLRKAFVRKPDPEKEAQLQLRLLSLLLRSSSCIENGCHHVIQRSGCQFAGHFECGYRNLSCRPRQRGFCQLLAPLYTLPVQPVAQSAVGTEDRQSAMPLARSHTRHTSLAIAYNQVRLRLKFATRKFLPSKAGLRSIWTH